MFSHDWGCGKQVGEHDIVLEYGSKALEKWEARSMRRDILFAMAMAHLGLASDALEAKEEVSCSKATCLPDSCNGVRQSLPVQHFEIRC